MHQVEFVWDATLVTYQNTKQRHKPEDLDLNLHRREDCRSPHYVASASSFLDLSILQSTFFYAPQHFFVTPPLYSSFRMMNMCAL